MGMILIVAAGGACFPPMHLEERQRRRERKRDIKTFASEGKTGNIFCSSCLVAVSLLIASRKKA